MKSLVLKFLTTRLPISAGFAFITTTMIGMGTNAEPQALALIALMILTNMTLGWLYGAGDGAQHLIDLLKETKTK